LRDRLKRLGVHKGASQLKPSRPGAAAPKEIPVEAPFHPQASQPRSQLARQPLWDLEQATAYGTAFIRRTRYPVDHIHGGRALATALSVADQFDLVQLTGLADLRDALFLDTETTGLAGGAGTLAFLVGVGYFETDDGRGTTDNCRPSSFVVDQFFLPDPAGEEGMLCALDERIGRHSALVTFNGRGFDVPLLETRYILARIPPALSVKPNLDLLMLSRRIWRNVLTSCSLGSLEYHILDVRRDQQDIPGFLIPQLYRDYLQTRVADDMERVMYHNTFDVLSMVTLASRIVDAMARPSEPAERLSAAMHYERIGDTGRAEEAYRAVLAVPGSPPALCDIALRRLARCLRRQDRRADALSCWMELADQDDAPALIELAKHYEWHDADLPQALACAQRALSLADGASVRAEIRHRIDRLNRKLTAPG